MVILDPRECEAARQCLEAGNPQAAARLLLASPHEGHRAVRRLLLQCGAALAAQARDVFDQGEATVAGDILELARNCSDLTADGLVLDRRIAKVRRSSVSAPPPRVPLDDRETPLAIRGRALVVSTAVAMLGSVRNPQADVPLLGRLHREHALISRHDGRNWIARAPHHQALVAVNGCDIQSPCLLEHGDRVTLGGHDHRGAVELIFLRPDAASTTAVLRQERRWIVSPGGDAFDRVVLMGDYLSVGRGEAAHLPSPRLPCEEVRFTWTPAGLTASAVGGAVYEETADGRWENLPAPLACPLRLVIAGDDDATAIFHDYRHGGESDERLELFDPRRRK